MWEERINLQLVARGVPGDTKRSRHGSVRLLRTEALSPESLTKDTKQASKNA